MWNIEKLVKKGDYLYAVVRNHPKATKHGYVLHHRIVMENAIGRLLEPGEVVHHLDENGHNNDIANLCLMTAQEHNRHHSTTGRTFVQCVCPNCGVTFIKEKRLYRLGSEPRCSRKCNGQYSRKIQMGIIKPA